MPESNRTMTDCTGQCQSCPAAAQGLHTDASVPQGWAQTLLWAVMFLGPLILAAAGAVWARGRWHSQAAQVLAGAAGFAVGVAGAMVLVRRALKRHADSSRCTTNDNSNR